MTATDDSNPTRFVRKAFGLIATLSGGYSITLLMAPPVAQPVAFGAMVTSFTCVVWFAAVLVVSLIFRRRTHRDKLKWSFAVIPLVVLALVISSLCYQHLTDAYVHSCDEIKYVVGTDADYTNATQIYVDKYRKDFKVQEVPPGMLLAKGGCDPEGIWTQDGIDRARLKLRVAFTIVLLSIVFAVVFATTGLSRAKKAKLI